MVYLLPHRSLAVGFNLLSRWPPGWKSIREPRGVERPVSCHFQVRPQQAYTGWHSARVLLVARASSACANQKSWPMHTDNGVALSGKSCTRTNKVSHQSDNSVEPIKEASSPVGVAATSGLLCLLAAQMRLSSSKAQQQIKIYSSLG